MENAFLSYVDFGWSRRKDVHGQRRFCGELITTIVSKFDPIFEPETGNLIEQIKQGLDEIELYSRLSSEYVEHILATRRQNSAITMTIYLSGVVTDLDWLR